MNKKKIALLLAGIMTVASLALVGCGNKDNGADAENGQTQEQQKGTKTYTYQQAGKYSTTIIDLTYEDGKPVDVVINEIQDGSSKRELCAKGEYVMKEGEENNWAAQVDLLAAFIKENNFDLSKVGSSADVQTTDAVAGVTIKVNGNVEAIKEAMDAIEAGTLYANEDLDVVKYEKEGQFGTVVVELKSYEGKPVDLFIDEIKDGKSKRELCAKGEYVMKEGEENNWAAQVDLLAAFIKENNFDLSKVGASADAPTTDAVSGVSIKVNDYVVAVSEAIEQAK